MNQFLHIFNFIFFILIQVFLLNNINYFGYVNPQIYIIFLILLPFNINKLLLIILGFVCGFSLDIISGGIVGIHTASCVFIAFIRPSVIFLVSSTRIFEKNTLPSIKDMNFKWFLLYSLLIILLHHTIYFYLEIFTFKESFHTIIRILSSSFFSLLLIIISQYLVYNPKKNK